MWQLFDNSTNWMHDLICMIAMKNNYNIFVVFEWYKSEKKILLRHETDRIHSSVMLNGFDRNLSTGILFLKLSFFIPQHSHFNV